jgi:UDP-N-acetylmuramate dehydrogenase
MLGGGSNTVFADRTVNALVCRIAADAVAVEANAVTACAGKILAVLINDLAAQGLDLSALTGIPGTVGGATFGNAGQGAIGIWLDTYVRSVHVYVNGVWQDFSRDECNYHYRESWFKDQTQTPDAPAVPPVIWSVTLDVPSRDPAMIKDDVERLLKKRIETQPHIKTAGSCFKSLPDGTPAWQLIEKAGLRGLKVGGVEVSDKHANFLLNTGGGTFADVSEITGKIKEAIPEIASIEMRLYGEDGKIR